MVHRVPLFRLYLLLCVVALIAFCVPAATTFLRKFFAPSLRSQVVASSPSLSPVNLLASLCKWASQPPSGWTFFLLNSQYIPGRISHATPLVSHSFRVHCKLTDCNELTEKKMTTTLDPQRSSSVPTTQIVAKWPKRWRIDCLVGMSRSPRQGASPGSGESQGDCCAPGNRH